MSSRPDAAIGALEDRIGHRFSDASLLRAALTHSSAGDAENYERLEFLGDRVLGLAMADILYADFPDESEGELARRLAALVQCSTLARIARALDLGAVLTLSGGAGTDNENILADSLEALLGALYRDAGFPPCRALVETLWRTEILSDIAPPRDPKTALQEWAQGRGLPLPVYEIAGREGPDHAPVFTIRASVKGHPPQEARGGSRRAAEKSAAESLLKILEGGQS